MKSRLQITNVIYQFHYPLQCCNACNKNKSNKYIGHKSSTLSGQLTNYLNDLSRRSHMLNSGKWPENYGRVRSLCCERLFLTRLWRELLLF